MTTRTEVILHDDLELYVKDREVEADLTITFAFNGIGYEIDLTRKNMDNMHEFLLPYMEAGRLLIPAKPDKPKITRSPRGINPKKNKTARNNVIRGWAKKEGYIIGDKGRIPAAIISEYERANS